MQQKGVIREQRGATWSQVLSFSWGYPEFKCMVVLLGMKVSVGSVIYFSV